MDIRREDLKPVLERAYCEVCGVELYRKDSVLMCHPPKYEYLCNNSNCLNFRIEFTSYQCYPNVRFIDSDGVDIQA